MPLCDGTGHILGRCCQHRTSTVPLLATNVMFTWNIQPVYMFWFISQYITQIVPSVLRNQLEPKYCEILWNGPSTGWVTLNRAENCINNHFITKLNKNQT